MSTDTELIRRPLRIAMVHYRDSAEGGGSLRVGETIANHLDPQRISAEMVFAYGDSGPITERAHVPCHFIRAKGPTDFPAWIRARVLFKQLQPHLIHFQDGVVWLRTALAGTPYKTILHVHGRYQVIRRKPIRKRETQQHHPFRASRLMRNYLKFTDAQVCINNGARNALIDLGWISAEKSYVVYNSIDLSRFNGEQDQFAARAQLNLPQGALLLGMVCRLVWEKGCGDLLSIIERLPLQWHGVICGDGPQKQHLERECEARGITSRVHFLGLQGDVGAVYAALDAYAFLSRYEPFGLVLVEAMASGVPVFGIEGDGEYKEAEYPLITSDTADLVAFSGSRHHETELPAPILDDIASRVSNYGEHPELHDEMTERARIWVSKCFSAPLQAQVMTGVYENICELGQMSPQKVSDWYQSKLRGAVIELAALEASKGERVLA